MKSLPTPPPLFLVGCGRSGTTMFRLMLDSHPEMAVPGESHFIPDLWRHRRSYSKDGSIDARRLAADIMRTPHFRLWGIPQETVWRRVEALRHPGFADVIAAVFCAYADQRRKLRWADKTPIYVLSMPLLAELWPTARFIHLIRDGRDVALSYLSVPWGPSTPWAAARKWRRDVTLGRATGRALGPSRYMEIRYEQLVNDPRQVLLEACSFAGLRFDEKMLEYHRDAGGRIQSPPDGMPFHARAAEPPTSGARDWRTQMPPSYLRAFEAVAGELLGELGYERRHPSTPTAWRARAIVRVSALNAWAVGSRLKKTLLETVGGKPPAGISRDEGGPSEMAAQATTGP